MYSVFEEFPKGWGVGGGGLKNTPKMENPGGWVLCEIPSVVGVWIFSGTTH